MIQFADQLTHYHGRKERVAVMIVGIKQIVLSLGDTERCAKDLGSAENTMSAIAARTGMSIRDQAGALHIHCRKLTRWKERTPRY